MALFDLVRPHWKHSDPAKRAEAMRLLEDDRQDLFVPAASQDTDAGVRLAAARRVEGETNLRTVLAKTGDRNEDKAAREVIQKALLRIVSARALTAPTASEAEARAWIEELRGYTGGEKALEEIALGSTSLTVRRAALSGITHASSLLLVAVREEDLALALEAFARLNRETQFETAAKSAKTREVRQAAKNKLKAIEEAKKPDAMTLNRAKLHILVSTIEKAEIGAREPGHGFDWDAARAHVDSATTAFEELLATGLPVADTLREQFEGSVTVFNQRHAVHVATETARHERDADEARIRTVREGICARLEALYADPNPADASEVEELTRTFNAAKPSVARDATAASADADPLRERFFIARDRLIKDKLRKQREAAEAGREAEYAVEKAARDARQAADRVAEAAEAERLAAARIEAEPALEKFVTELEMLAGSPDLKTAEKRLREIQSRGKTLLALLGETAPGVILRYHAAAEHLRETLDWNRWANLRRKQELCTQLEALLPSVTVVTAVTAAADETTETTETAADPAATRAAFNRFKTLVTEWKSVGHVPWDESEAMWERYHQVSDALYERFREYFAELDGEREENLKAKEELCAKLETLLAAPEIDWREASEAFREAHSAWKAIGAAPREKSEALWERFRAVNKAFQERRDGNLTENLRAKRELATLVEGLKDSREWKKAATAIKEAQEQWKTIGPVPRDKSESLWNRFHGACEAFFTARKAHFDQLDQERPINLEKKLALCERVEKLEELPGDRERYEAILDAQSQWKEIGQVPREHEDAIWERFRKPIDLYFQNHREKTAGERELREAGEKEKEALCLEAEALRDSTEWKATIEKIKALQARWKASPPAPRHLDQALWHRFRSACDAFFARLKENSAGRDEERLGNLRLKTDLCFAVEIYSGVPATDPAAQAARDAWVEAQRAAGNGVPEFNADWNALANKVKTLQTEWRGIGPTPREENDAVWVRFQRACDVFFEEQRRANPRPGEDPQHNLDEKLALIAHAEELALDPARRHEASVEELRRDWKRIGPVPRAQSDYVWDRFHAACEAAVPRRRGE